MAAANLSHEGLIIFLIGLTCSGIRTCCCFSRRNYFRHINFLEVVSLFKSTTRLNCKNKTHRRFMVFDLYADNDVVFPSNEGDVVRCATNRIHQFFDRSFSI